MTEVFARSAGPELRHAGAVLTVDLAALVENWRALAAVSEPAQTAGVLKADAYGLGAGPVAAALAQAGCRTFFVALPEEGVAVRAAAPEARILVLNGLFGEDSPQTYAEHSLIPVLNSATDLRIWETFCGVTGTRHPCAIHVDTGMNRLGLTAADALAFAQDNALTGAIHPILLMSHLACADEPAHPMNAAQLESFQAIGAAFGPIERSLANSAGILLGKDHHFDLTRPGIAVYGGSPLPGVRNPMRTVVSAQARVVQVRHAHSGETVGYGATARLERDTIIAVCAAGYGDGYSRAGSGSGVALRETGRAAAQGFVAGRRVPVIGRITMDLTMFDVTDYGHGAVNPGDFVELFGPNIPIDEAARAAGTIAYEILTSIGRRYHRQYVGMEA